jgi:hypothetical protein
MDDLRDAKWRSLAAERKAAAARKPSLDDREGAMATLLALHDQVGPQAIGAALNALDREDERLRVNGVRYYEFAALREAMLDRTKDKKQRRAIEELLPK